MNNTNQNFYISSLISCRFYLSFIEIEFVLTRFHANGGESCIVKQIFPINIGLLILDYFANGKLVFFTQEDDKFRVEEKFKEEAQNKWVDRSEYF